MTVRKLRYFSSRQNRLPQHHERNPNLTLNPTAILRGFGRSFCQIRMISKLHARATDDDSVGHPLLETNKRELGGVVIYHPKNSTRRSENSTLIVLPWPVVSPN